ncbi:2-nitropropane dioxygenase [Lentinus tigrinus ALCF2SS1-7]|uniref:2-nitropropane dioxygenase n=1 Tax=Lentinus tigrinus ALCF2SS1-6 TaxID=1328759 RepID=A0A5C2S1A6_9APHY|nr:2-nitropropane dioxygenase [Lentinus tigrinus ALCF2SS1-6]RPD73153.1 2-nitropropane dioxygenase [Lentinus tigrinus ALCF2SS1-7]
MEPVNTSFTRLLGITVPVVSPPMALATTTHHAAEATRGGGFGFLGAAFTPPEKLREDLASLRKTYPDLGDKPLPVGVGLIAWMLDADEEAAKAKIDAILDNNVKAFWLAFGTDIHRWIQYARTSPGTARSQHKPLIFVQATSVDEALLAANEWKADVIVAQGTEAGGHGGAHAPSTFTFVSELLAALPPNNAPPILAAGGLANGTQAAAYLTLGAAGVVLGTRFTLTPECPWPPAEHKPVLLAANSGSTVRTLAMDYALGLYGWPEGLNGRGIRNKIYEDLEGGVSHETLRERFAKAAEEGSTEYAVIFSGQGVTLMHEIKPVKEVMEELHADIVRQLRRSQGLLQV